MNWKEQLKKIKVVKHQEADEFIASAIREVYPVCVPAIEAFISTEIIEKLIGDALHLHNRHPLDAEQQLKSKWLGKELK